jgi:Ca-activated chloride channel homolog
MRIRQYATTLSIVLSLSIAGISASQTLPDNQGEQTKSESSSEPKATSIEIIVDCSRSMDDSFAGTFGSKMDAVKQMLALMVQSIPDGTNLGLRVLGQSFQGIPYVDRKASALLVPIGRDNRENMVQLIRELQPLGLSPLTYALYEASIDLSKFSGEKRIILISDSADTCGADPCAFVHSLVASGNNINIDAIGIGLKHDPTSKIELICIASQAGGHFYDSNTEDELLTALGTEIHRLQKNASNR